MKPYYDEDGITVYHGDCREVLPELSADVVLTDPPYGVGKEYGTSYIDKADGYWDFMRGVVDQARLVSNAVVMTHRVLALRELVGWDWVAVWVKRNQQMRLFSMPVLPTWEPILCWGIKGRQVPHRSDGFMFDAIPSTAVVGGEHPFPKPVPLMGALVDWLKPESVLDPFMGSGSTLAAARLRGVPAIGIEIEERYCEIAVQRLAQGVLEFG